MVTNDIKVTSVSDCWIVTASGPLDLASSKDRLQQVVRQGVFCDERNVLIDIRDVPVDLSLTDILAFTDEYTKVQSGARRRVALVTLPERFANSEFFAITAKTKGSQVQAFTSMEDAFEWLAL